MSEKKTYERLSSCRAIFEIDGEAWLQMNQRERLEQAGLLRLAIVEAITENDREFEDEDQVAE